MAQNETQEVGAQQVVAIPADVYARREAAREYEAMRKSGVKLDETRPGGYFIGADGNAHDAEGKPIVEPEAAAPADEKKAETKVDVKAKK